MIWPECLKDRNNRKVILPSDMELMGLGKKREREAEKVKKSKKVKTEVDTDQLCIEESGSGLDG